MPLPPPKPIPTPNQSLTKTVDEVCDLLDQHGLSEYKSQFQKLRMNGMAMGQLSRMDDGFVYKFLTETVGMVCGDALGLMMVAKKEFA